jgi:hypothetical protein
MSVLLWVVLKNGMTTLSIKEGRQVLKEDDDYCYYYYCFSLLKSCREESDDGVDEDEKERVRES